MLEFHGHDHRRAFPLNILVLLAIILMLAYITRCVGRFFQQTFDNRDVYEWKEILSLR